MFVESLRRALRDARLLQSFSGVRTAFGRGADISSEHAALATAYGYFYAERCARLSARVTILVGRDPRPTGEAISSALARGFIAATDNGRRLTILNLGIITTPLLQSAARALRAHGGVMITASHNPLEDNGWKFLTGVVPWSDSSAPEGALLSSVDMGEIVRAVAALADGRPEQAARRIENVPAGSYEAADPAQAAGARDVAEELYLRAISDDWGLQPDRPDEPALGRILLDPNGGAACGINRRFLEHFGADPVEVNCELACPAHPIDTDGLDPATGDHVLTRVARAALLHNARFGIAFDYDADRGNLVLPGEDSSAIVPPQSVAALNVMLALSRLRAHGDSADGVSVVASESTSGMTEDIARRFGAETAYVETGEVNVVTKMRELRRLGRTVPVGVEGANGGVVFYNSTCRDGVLTALSAALSEVEDHDGCRSLKDLIAALPSYHTPMIRVETAPADHTAVKNAMESLFEREFWPRLAARFRSFKILNYEGTSAFTSNDLAERQGGWKLVLESPERRAWLFARGSRTEAGVWRLGADSSNQQEADELLGVLKTIFDQAVRRSAR